MEDRGQRRNCDLGQRLSIPAISRTSTEISTQRIRPGDVRSRHLRFYGHILSLIARAFLYGENCENSEAGSKIFGLPDRQEDDLEHWRKKGSV